MTRTRLATIRRDLTKPAGITDATDLRRWRVGYLAGLLDQGEATHPDVLRLVLALPDAAALIREAKALLAEWRAGQTGRAA